MKRKGKHRPRLTEEMRTVLDYVLEHEGEDYHNWCADEGLNPDSKEAMSKHVYGSACKVLGRKPSYFDGNPAMTDATRSQVDKTMARYNED